MFRDTSVSDFDPTLPTSAPDRRRVEQEVGEAEPVVAVCFVCRCRRAGDGAWSTEVVTLDDGFERQVSHGLCPGCLDRLYPEPAAGERAG